MRVIGTAGHVDHGKSTLVQALTGTHPDRLKEEREREMTIDLGFAFLDLPNGEELGIVDVPGHRDFIENMLSGVGGIDAVLFVIAADEGIMPQTREHLAILDLLKINGGLIALTKTDMVADPDWLELVEEEIKSAVTGTVLANAPIFRVSAVKGDGVAELLTGIEHLLEERPQHSNLGRPRLPVDRVFTMSGFGTIVTGTLTDGSFQAGQEVTILPEGERGRIRGLQSNKLKLETVAPGSRVAVNISGVSLEQVARGNWIAAPGDYEPTRRIDVQFEHLTDASLPLKHNVDMKFFVGAAEVMGRVRLLGAEILNPGESGWLQIELSEPIIARRGDRFILRRPSPAETIGGGAVIEPHPTRRHKRFDKEMLSRLESLAEGSPEDVFAEALLALGITRAPEVRQKAALDAVVADEIFEALVERDEILILEADKPVEQSLIVSRGTWDAMQGQAVAAVQDFHALNPLRAGLPREELKSRLKFKANVFTFLMTSLTSEGRLRDTGRFVALPAHEINLTTAQEDTADSLLKKFAASPYSTPSVKDVTQEIGEPLLLALLDLGELFQVSQDVLFAKQAYEQMVAETKAIIEQKGEITIADFRDHFQTSRKYALGLLEHLDAIGVTIRAGDGRKLRG
jgi:selenocysteine-specific elongation factor